MKYAVLTILCCCLLVGCEGAYPPVIVNGYDKPIEISVSYVADIPPAIGIRIPPRTEFVQPQKGLIIDQLKVKDPFGKVHVYQAADLDRVRGDRKSNFEVWVLTENGLKLSDEEGLRKIKAERKVVAH